MKLEQDRKGCIHKGVSMKMSNFSNSRAFYTVASKRKFRKSPPIMDTPFVDTPLLVVPAEFRGLLRYEQTYPIQVNDTVFSWSYAAWTGGCHRASLSWLGRMQIGIPIRPPPPQSLPIFYDRFWVVGEVNPYQGNLISLTIAAKIFTKPSCQK